MVFASCLHWLLNTTTHVLALPPAATPPAASRQPPRLLRAGSHPADRIADRNGLASTFMLGLLGSTQHYGIHFTLIYFLLSI